MCLISVPLVVVNFELIYVAEKTPRGVHMGAF